MNVPMAIRAKRSDIREIATQAVNQLSILMINWVELLERRYMMIRINFNKKG